MPIYLAFRNIHPTGRGCGPEGTAAGGAPTAAVGGAPGPAVGGIGIGRFRVGPGSCAAQPGGHAPRLGGRRCRRRRWPQPQPWAGSRDRRECRGGRSTTTLGAPWPYAATFPRACRSIFSTFSRPLFFISVFHIMISGLGLTRALGLLLVPLLLLGTADAAATYRRIVNN